MADNEDFMRFLASWALVHETADEGWKSAVARGNAQEPGDMDSGSEAFVDGLSAIIAERKEQLKAELAAGTEGDESARLGVSEHLDELRFEVAELQRPLRVDAGQPRCDSGAHERRVLRRICRQGVAAWQREVGRLPASLPDAAPPRCSARISDSRRDISDARSRRSRSDRAFEELGPAWIKLGQMISVRPDLFPAEWVFELGGLQDSVAPLPAAAIRRIIESEFGRPAEKLFASFDDEPVASASIAQVHRAVLAEAVPAHRGGAAARRH